MVYANNSSFFFYAKATLALFFGLTSVATGPASRDNPLFSLSSGDGDSALIGICRIAPLTGVTNAVSGVEVAVRVESSLFAGSLSASTPSSVSLGAILTLYLVTESCSVYAKRGCWHVS